MKQYIFHYIFHLFFCRTAATALEAWTTFETILETQSRAREPCSFVPHLSEKQLPRKKRQYRISNTFNDSAEIIRCDTATWGALLLLRIQSLDVSSCRKRNFTRIISNSWSSLKTSGVSDSQKGQNKRSFCLHYFIAVIFMIFSQWHLPSSHKEWLSDITNQKTYNWMQICVTTHKTVYVCFYVRT